MPALTAKFTADASQMNRELDRAGKMAVAQSRAIENSIRHAFPQKSFNSSSTLYNSSEAKTAAQEYGEFWQKALKGNEQASIGWIRRLREARKERAQQKADAVEQALDEAKSNELASMAWIRRLREARKERAQQKADAVEQALDEAKSNELASMAWIRRLREARKARAAEKALSYLSTTDMIREAATSGVGGVGGREHGRTGVSGILGESMVIMREIGRGNFARVPGSVTILAQRMGLLGKVLKSSAAFALEHAAAENKLLISLAQTAVATELTMGKNAAATVVAREAVVVQQAQALAAQEAAEMQLATAKVSVTTLGYLLGALLAVGAGAYFVWQHVKKLNDAIDKTDESMEKAFGDPAKSKLEAMKEAGKAAGELADHIHELADAHLTLTESTDESLAAMREEFTLMRELARLKGEKKGDELKAEQEMRRREMEVIEKNLAQARKNREEAEQKEKEATAKAFTGEDAIKRNANLKDIQRQMTQAEENVKKYEEIKKELQTAVDEEMESARAQLSDNSGGGLSDEEIESRLEAEKKKIFEKVRVTKGGEAFSMDSAIGLLGTNQKYLNRTPQMVEKLEATQRELEKAKESASKGDDKAVADVKNLEKKRDELARQIGLHDKYDSKLADAQKQHGGQGFTMTEHQRLGAYVGGPQVALLSEAKIHTHVLKSIEHKIGARHAAPHSTSRRGF